MKFQSLYLLAVLLLSSKLLAWNSPIGIPEPSFGINQSHLDYSAQSYDFGSGLQAYPNAGAGPYTHYVNHSDPNCSDSINTDFNFGSPATPRCTIPGRDGNALKAGSVVEVHGLYNYAHTSPRDFHGEGTFNQPIYIRGPSELNKAIITQPFAVIGSQYVIFENLEFGDEDGDLSGGTTGRFSVVDKNGLEYDSNHITLRNSELHGNESAGGIGIGRNNPDTQISNIVIFNNFIHDNGDVEAEFDQDVHCISVGAGVSHLWVVDNTMARCSGDGLQINAGTSGQASLHHVYVGRNTSHGHKQSGMWSKQAVDVIFSENTIYNLRPSNSSNGACMGQQYAPQYTWYLFNHLHDCESGIRFESDSGLGFGTHSYIIGNLVHNISSTESWEAGNPHDSAAIGLRGGTNRFIINNTLWDYQAGILSPSGGRLEIVNNILGARSQSQGRDIYIEHPTTASNATMNNNLIEGVVRIQWGNSTVHNLTEFQSATALGSASLNSGPHFIDENNESFGLLDSSPAIDNGLLHHSYAEFFSRYGLDINKDASGRSRPQNGFWDIGAYEFAGDLIFADGFE